MQPKLLHTKPVQKQTKDEPQCNTAARRRAKELDAREKDPQKPTPRNLCLLSLTRYVARRVLG